MNMWVSTILIWHHWSGWFFQHNPASHCKHSQNNDAQMELGTAHQSPRIKIIPFQRRLLIDFPFDSSSHSETNVIWKSDFMVSTILKKSNIQLTILFFNYLCEKYRSRALLEYLLFSLNWSASLSHFNIIFTKSAIINHLVHKLSYLI